MTNVHPTPTHVTSMEQDIQAKGITAPGVSPADIDANIISELYLTAADDHPGYVMTAEQIARVCHEVNRAYCDSLGDNSQLAWEHAPQWQKDSAMLGVRLHSENNVGPAASHESWMAQKVSEGWVHGAIKDPVAKTHHCIVPFIELPPAQQAKDYIFRAVVHALRETDPDTHAASPV